MSLPQGVRSFLLQMAGHIVRSEPLSEGDRAQLALYASQQSLVNPTEIHCKIKEHRTWGIVVLPDEVIRGAAVGHIREQDGQWICTECGDGRNVTASTI